MRIKYDGAAICLRWPTMQGYCRVLFKYFFKSSTGMFVHSPEIQICSGQRPSSIYTTGFSFIHSSLDHTLGQKYTLDGIPVD